MDLAENGLSLAHPTYNAGFLWERPREPRDNLDSDHLDVKVYCNASYRKLHNWMDNFLPNFIEVHMFFPGSLRSLIFNGGTMDIAITACTRPDCRMRRRSSSMLKAAKLSRTFTLLMIYSWPSNSMLRPKRNHIWN